MKQVSTQNYLKAKNEIACMEICQLLAENWWLCEKKERGLGKRGMNGNLKKLAKNMDGVNRQINLGFHVNFQKAKIEEEKLAVNLGYVYAGTQGAMMAEADEKEVTLLVMHVIDTDFPFINAVIAFDTFTAKLPQEEGRTYFKDMQGYIETEDVKFLAAGNKFSYQGELTEIKLLEFIRKTVVFSYEFDKMLQGLIYKRPRPVKDEQVSEDLRYLLVRQGLEKANSIGEQELYEKEDRWEIMNSFQICDQNKTVIDEVPGILSFGKKNEEMAVEVLIDAKPETEIEKYQQGAIQMAVQARANKIDYSDEYIVNEEGTFFKFKFYGNYGYDPEKIVAFINAAAGAAANLILKIH